MTRQTPKIVRFSLSDSGRLSLLIDFSTSGLSSSSFKFLLQEHGSKSNTEPLEFVRDVQGMGHYQVTLNPGRKFFILCTSASGRRYRLEIPDGIATLQHPVLPTFLRKIRRFLGLRTPYIVFYPDKHQYAPRILTNHDSVHIWLPSDQRLLIRRRKSDLSISSRSSVGGGVNVFALNEIGEALYKLRDGESLWDFYLLDDPDRRLSYWGPKSVDPRKSFKYPWFWLGDERTSAKARIYWTVDGHLALKVIKKGLR